MSSNRHQRGEGLKLARLLMVLSSLSPLFILWGIRGIEFIPNGYFVLFCTIIVVIPNVILIYRLLVAISNRDEHTRHIGHTEDNRPYLLAYLFSMLLPFYRQDFETLREVLAVSAALSVIIFLFWHLNLHYLNIFVAIFDYRIFTVHPPMSDNPNSDTSSFILITRRRSLNEGQRLTALRITDTVYMERSR